MTVLVPLIVIVIFCRAIAAETEASILPDPSAPKKRPENLTLLSVYQLVFVAAVELSLLSYVSTGCIFRVAEFENKISHFLFVSGGSRMAYRLANYSQDLLELAVIVGATMAGTKLIAFGKLSLRPRDLGLCLVVLLHNAGKVLLLGYPLSLLFNSKKNLLSYYNLFNMGLVLLLLAAAVYSFSHAAEDSALLSLLNYLSVSKLAANCALALVPDRNAAFVPYRDAVAARFGGFGFNLLLLLLHLGAYFCLNVWLDARKHRFGLVPQRRKEPLPPVELLRNEQELQDELAYVQATQPQISVVGLEKTHANGFTAVQGVTFGVEPGQVFTLLGPNGAGKSSLLDVLCGVSSRSAGEVRYQAEAIERHGMRSVCFCLQGNFLWEHLTFEEHVRIVGSWRGLDRATVSALLGEVDRGLDLGKNLRIKALHLSAGNQRKLNTVLALLSAPQVYVLDEPTAGMDPKSRRYFWNVLKTWKQRANCSLVLTTHTANEAEELSDKIGILLNSQMIRINELQRITSKGFIVKLFADSKLPGSWPAVMAGFEAAVRQLLRGDEAEQRFQKLQFNPTNRASFQLPLCPRVPTLSRAMRLCADFCGELEREQGLQVRYFASKMNLEQAFLAYASHQLHADKQ